MKYLLILPLLAALSLSSCKNAEDKNAEPSANDFAYNSYGEEISAAGCSLLLIVVSPAIVGSATSGFGVAGYRMALIALADKLK